MSVIMMVISVCVNDLLYMLLFKSCFGSSDGKFGSFYWLGPLSLVQQNERIFFRVISSFSKYN